ncbi:MAG: twin-arginine translocase TatA/TatE family subunit [Alphaproteobacteria bacterium]|nr:twin-arginine translocase TatA/TatE family subunit [Alphaproteobacteria bacterium]
MLNFGTWGEFLIILITALVVIGPKDIPKTLKLLGRWVHKFRKVTQQVRGYVDELAFDAQRDEIMSMHKDKEHENK